MNTNSAMRTVLAAAAAGALVLGSAGAATAAPKSPKAKGPKVVAAADATIKLSKVDIKRHKKIDLADVTATTAINLRAMVRYSTKVESKDALASFGVKLAVYDKKVNGKMVEDSETIDATPLTLKPRTKAKKNQFYAGSATILSVWTTDQVKALADAVAANGKAYICISSVDTDFDKYSKQTKKRLGDAKRPVRDCVKVVGELPVTPPAA